MVDTATVVATGGEAAMGTGIPVLIRCTLLALQPQQSPNISVSSPSVV